MIQKHFKNVPITVILEMNSSDFQDGNWESLGIDGNLRGVTLDYQEDNGRCN